MWVIFELVGKGQAGLHSVFLIYGKSLSFFIPQNITDSRLLVQKIPTYRMHHGGANFCTGEVVLSFSV